MVNNGEVILGEKKGSTGLLVRKFLFCMEVSKVVMVGPNFKWFRVALKVVMKVFEGANNGEKFFIMDIIVEFGRLHGL